MSWFKCMTHYDTEEIKDVLVAVNYHWHFGIVIFDLRLLWFLRGLEQNDGENAKKMPKFRILHFVLLATSYFNTA